MDEYRCNKCLKIYLQLKTLRRHVKQSHPDEIEDLAPLPKRKFTCEICQKPYNNKKSLSKHKRSLHNVEYVPLHKPCVCPLCRHKLFQKYKLFEHFKNQHDINLEVTDHTFETLEDFKLWKEEISLQTKSKFVKNGNGGSSFKRKTKFIYYICYRSGQFSYKENRKRNLKKQGSNKINGVCPASLSVKIKDSGITTVRFVQTHVGHENDLGHLTLSANKRKGLAKKIALNVPFNTIHSLSQHLSMHESKAMDIASTSKEITSLTAEISNNKSYCEKSLEEEISELHLEWNCITQMIKSKQHLQTVKNHLKSIKCTLEAVDEVQGSGSFPQLKGSIADDDDREPHNKKIIPQRLFSTKKKAKTAKSSVSTPSTEEQTKIAMLLLNFNKNST